MSEPSQISCPHCGTANQSAASFCEACGKALPTLTAAAPRIVTEAALPSTAAGRQLLGAELQKHLKKAKGALLTVAVMQTIFGALIIGVSKATLPAGETVPAVLVITLVGIAAIFYGLYAWARRSPLPAAIVGLILFVTLHLIDALADPRQITRGLIVKVIIVAMLAQAIQAGVKYKRLLPQLQPV
jgi:hypothetical protein